MRIGWQESMVEWVLTVCLEAYLDMSRPFPTAVGQLLETGSVRAGMGCSPFAPKVSVLTSP